MQNKEWPDPESGRVVTRIVYFLILAVYLTGIILITRVARSTLVIMLWGTVMPLSSFTGVISALNNICIIMLVVFFRKTGFITAIILLMLQFPMMIFQMILIIS